MRRWIAIFLLLLLPLQAVWAAMEPYCLHETRPSDTHHLGHHEHQHHLDAAGDDHHASDQAQQDQDSPASAMLDHDHHCCSAVSLLSTAMPLPGPLPQAELVSSPLAGYTSFDATRIERPNWTTSS